MAANLKKTAAFGVDKKIRIQSLREFQNSERNLLLYEGNKQTICQFRIHRTEPKGLNPYPLMLEQGINNKYGDRTWALTLERILRRHWFRCY